MINCENGYLNSKIRNYLSWKIRFSFKDDKISSRRFAIVSAWEIEFSFENQNFSFY